MAQAQLSAKKKKIPIRVYITSPLRDGLDSQKNIFKTAYNPTLGSPESAGIDIRSPVEYTLPPRSTTSINTHLSMILPPNHYGRIVERSSMAQDGLVVGGGVIDPDFRGEISIIIHNLRDIYQVVEVGQKIGQIVIERCALPLDITWIGDKGNTLILHCDHQDRGVQGLGSTTRF